MYTLTLKKKGSKKEGKIIIDQDEFDQIISWLKDDDCNLTLEIQDELFSAFHSFERKYEVTPPGFCVTAKNKEEAIENYLKEIDNDDFDVNLI